MHTAEQGRGRHGKLLITWLLSFTKLLAKLNLVHLLGASHAAEPIQYCDGCLGAKKVICLGG